MDFLFPYHEFIALLFYEPHMSALLIYFASQNLQCCGARVTCSNLPLIYARPLPSHLVYVCVYFCDMGCTCCCYTC